MSNDKMQPQMQKPTVAMPRQPSLTVDQAMAAASQLHAQGRLQDAEMMIKKILGARPNHPPALYLLGIIAHQAGKTDIAADLLGHAIVNGGENAGYYATRAEILRILGRVDEAITHGQKAVSLDTKLVMAHANLGIAFFDKGDMQMAEQCQRAALKLDPAFPVSLNNMGSIMLAKGDEEAAADYYRRALEAMPGYPDPARNLQVMQARRQVREEGAETA